MNDPTRPPSNTARLLSLGRADLITSDGARDPFPTLRGKPLALLCRLAFTSTHSLSRDALAEALWRDLDIASARAQLRTALWQIRKRLGVEAIDSDDNTVALSAPIASDRADFEAAIQAHDRKRAIDLYTGDFLAGFAVPGAGGFDEWADFERRMLRQLYVATVEGEVSAQLAVGHFRESVVLAQRLRDLEPFSQAAWRLLLRSHSAAGNHDAAKAAAQSLTEFASDERLTLEAETVAVMRSATRLPAQETKGTGPHDLVPDLVGREQELAVMLGLLESCERSRARTIRILGRPGIGKTRLTTDFARTAVIRKGSVAIVTGARTTTRTAFGGLARLVERLATLPGGAGVSEAVSATLVDLSPTLSSVYRAKPSSPPAADAARVRTSAVADLVRSVSAERVLAIIVDDAQWLDEPSREAIEAIPDLCADCAVVVVLAERELPAGGAIGRSDATIVLPVLGRDDCEAFVTSLAELPDALWSNQWIAALHDASGGVPLTLTDLLRLAIDKDRVAIADGAWTTADSAALIRLTQEAAPRSERIAQLSSDARRIATLCGCARESLEPSIITEVLGLEAAEFDVACDDLAAHGIGRIVVDRVALDHEEYGATIRETVQPPLRRSLLVQLATSLLARHDIDSARRAFVHAESASDDALATEAARRYLVLAKRRSPSRTTTELLADLMDIGGKGARLEGLAGKFDARRKWARAGWAAAIVASLAAVTAAAVSIYRVPEPDVALSLVLSDEANAQYEATAPISLANWIAGKPIEIDASSPRLITRQQTSALARSYQAPARWLGQRSHDKPNFEDIVLINPGHSEETLVDAPGDDVSPAWSVDGRWIAYVTARWTGRDWADIALLDLKTRKTTRVAGGTGEVGGVSFSNDGSGIAFSRSTEARSRVEICVMRLDSRIPRCHPQPPGRRVTVGPTWVYSSTVLFGTRDDLESASLVRSWDLDSDSEREVAFCRGVLPNTQTLRSVVACYLDADPKRTVVAPIAHPEQWRPIIVRNARVNDAFSLMVADLRLESQFTGLAIGGPRNAVVGVPHQLWATAVSADGQSVAFHPKQWEVTGHATIDSTGLFLPLSPGSVLVRAVGAQGISDSTTLTVHPSTDVVLLSEQWDSTWLSRWRQFGEPFPSIVTDGGQRAFWNAGDGAYISGAYTKQTFDVSGGLTLDADVVIPVTEHAEEWLRVSLMGAIDSVAKANWDHRTGYLARGKDAWECAFEYPRGVAGKDFGNLYTGPVGMGTATPDMRAGRRFHLTLQAFPDGRCSAAANGVVLQTTSRGGQRHPVRVVLYGSSVRTRVLVYGLELRSGMHSIAESPNSSTRPH